MADIIFTQDTFTDADGTLLADHVGEIGALWSQNPAANYGTTGGIINSNEMYFNSFVVGNDVCWQASGVPVSADQYTEAVVIAKSLPASGVFKIFARQNASNATAYMARYNLSGTRWQLYRVNSSASITQLGSDVVQSLSVGQVLTVKLLCQGTTISLIVDGVTKISVTDSTVTAKGRAALGAQVSAATATTLFHFQSVIGAVPSFAATGYSLAGPANATTGVASGNITVSLTPTGGTSSDAIITPSDGGAGGSFTPTTVTLNTASPTATFTYTKPSAGTVTISTTNSLSLTDPSSIQISVLDAAVIPVTDSNIIWSPYNWVLATGSKMRSNANQGYVKVGFTGTSIKVDVDGSALVAAGIVSALPQFYYTIDAGTIQTATIPSANASTITLASGLAAGSHRLRMWNFMQTNTNDMWNVPSYCWVINDFRLDGGQSTVTAFDEITELPLKGVFYGDSITQARSSASDVGDPRAAWANTVGHALNAEYGVIGWGGTGWGKGGNSNAVSFFNSWNYQDANTPRVFDPQPDFVVVEQGQNDQTPFALQTGVIPEWIFQFRQSCPQSYLFIMVPISQVNAALILSQVASYQAQFPNDKRIFTIDLGVNNAFGLNDNPTLTATWLSNDNVHPNNIGSAWLAPQIACQIQAILSGGNGINFSNCLFSNVSIG